MLLRNRAFLMDLAAALMIPVDLILGCRAFLDGHAPIAAMYLTAAIMLIWAARHFADFILTGFCLWYLKRSMTKHFAIVAKMEAKKNEHNKDF